MLLFISCVHIKDKVATPLLTPWIHCRDILAKQIKALVIYEYSAQEDGKPMLTEKMTSYRVT